MGDKSKIKYILGLITIILIIVINYYYYYKEEKLKIDENNVEETIEESKENILENGNAEQVLDEETIEYVKTEDIPRSIQGYSVIAKLEIPRISLSTYVLNETTNSALNVSVTKFWGADPNEVGNFCVAGHNMRGGKMFNYLKYLSINDEITLTDMKGRKVVYVIYSIFTVDPYNTSCVSQKTNGKKEVTLITCTTTSKSRLIVKATQK